MNDVARFRLKNRRLNLNLLTVLDMLLEARNVTVAGQRLGLSQPATSTALSKLRQAFKDDLLVAVGRELQLTPKAQALREPLRELIDSLGHIFEEDELVPAAIDGEFVIATADYMPIVIGPALIAAFADRCPHLTLRFTNITFKSTAHLRSGEVDMLIAPTSLINDATVISRYIFSDRFVCVYQRQPGAPARTIGLDEYLASRHIATVIDSVEPVARRTTYVKEVDDLRAGQDNMILVPFYGVLPLIAADSSLLALVQERMARIFSAHMPIGITDPPVELPPLEYAMFWSPRVRREQRNKWIRDMIHDVCRRHFRNNAAPE